MPKYNKKTVKKLKKQAIDNLLKFNIEDTFTLKIKDPQNNDWIAEYRALSQFMNGGRGPIFWLAPELINNPKEFVISVLHEYGHVIAEWVWINRNDAMRKILSKTYRGNFGSRPWDEESWAEDFAQYLFGNKSSNAKAINRIVTQYINQYKKPFKIYVSDFN